MGWLRRAAVPAVALVAFLLALGLFHGRGLHDTDAAYHLAVARAYAQGVLGVPHEVLHDLPWTRFSLFHEGFGDKEILFHAFLAPFTAEDPAATLGGGRLALALLLALLAALAAEWGRRWVGWWGLLLPFWLPLASTEMAWRLVRLRPELLALLLLTLALLIAARGRYRWLAPVAFVFTWSYTAFHALGGLMVLVALAFWWRERRPPWALLLYTGLGIGAALVLHPHFPHNLEVWAVQNLAFFQHKGELAVGTEIRPNFTDVTLMVHLGWLVGLAALWRSRTSRPQAPEHGPSAREARRLADALAVAAFCFGVLYLLMARFSLYAIPFVTLWLLAEIRARNQRVGPWVALPAGRRMPLAVAALVSLLLSAPVAVGEFQRFRERTFLGPHGERLADWRAVGEAIPDGAPVAADWGPTGTYMLWARQGRYLNALDPVFLAVPHPDKARTLRRLLDGDEPDIPLAAVAALESPFLAYPRATAPAALEARLEQDPRVEFLHRGFHAVVRFRPALESFVRDWQREGEAAESGEEAGEAPRTAAADALAGYVDVRPWLQGDPACASVERRESVTTPRRELYELAPAGATVLWLDGQPLAAVTGDLGAILGRGVQVEAALPAGEHHWRVDTCRERGDSGRAGFYLWRRHR